MVGKVGHNVRLLSAWISVLLLLASGSAAGSERLALVIGNGAYQYDVQLANPANDATDLAAALRTVGFDVVEGIDLTKSEMEYTIREFASRLRDSEAVMVFYAGHGLQIDGKNYLLPIDANIEDLRDVWLQAVDLEIIFKVIEGENRVNLIFLDACRNNAFAQLLPGLTGANRGRGSRGLAQVRTAIGSLIAFATEPGNVASDGTGRNSPFTEALLRHIATPGLEVRSMLSRVRQDVVEKTEGKQVPWDHSSLVGAFYFNGTESSVAAAPAVSGAPADQTENNSTGQSAEIEIAYWNAVKDSSDPKELESYLSRWPAGSFTALARRRLERLSTPATPKVTAEPKPAVQDAVTLFTHKNANVRAAPSTEAERIGVVPRGQQVAVIEPNARPKWHKVRLGDGRIGYIWAPLLHATAAPQVQVAVAPSPVQTRTTTAPSQKTALLARPAGRWKGLQDGCFFDGYDYATVYVLLDVKGQTVSARIEVHDHGEIVSTYDKTTLQPDGSFVLRDSNFQVDLKGRIDRAGKPQDMHYSDCGHFSWRKHS